MTGVFLKIYDWLCAHRKTAVITVIVITLLSVVSLLRLHYEEDIAGFLPIDRSDSRQTELMEQLSRQNSVAVIFRADDSEADTDSRIIDAMDLYEDIWFEKDTMGLVPDLSALADESMGMELIGFVQEHYASFLTESDYRRMDSLLSQPGYVESQLEADRRSLQMLSGTFTAQTIPYDPLGLFGNILLNLADIGGNAGYRIVDGHILHKEEPAGILFFESPYGESESAQNAVLKRLAESVADDVYRESGVRVSVIGAPVIAVTNADRIKRDSILAVGLAVIGILAVLWSLVLSWHYRPCKRFHIGYSHRIGFGDSGNSGQLSAAFPAFTS